MSAVFPLVILGFAALVDDSAVADKQKVDNAIENGLKYLQSTQTKDGDWLLASKKNPAITSLCLLSFLSAGHLPNKGPYTETFNNGLRWVVALQNEDGVFTDIRPLEMYHQGICTFFLAEAFAKGDDKLKEQLKPRLEKALRVIEKAQRTKPDEDQGGWRYQIKHEGGSDMSVTGWQILAIVAAKRASLQVPQKVLDNALAFVRRNHDRKGGGFYYWHGGRSTQVTTATGILGLLFLGDTTHGRPVEALKGGDYLLKNSPQSTRIHLADTIYNASLASFHLNEHYWASARANLYAAYFDKQDRTGAWRISDLDARFYGESYTTAMMIMALTIEKQHLLMHQLAPREKPRE